MNTDKNTFKYRIGNTVYIVGLKSAETAKEEYDTKLRKMITKEVLSPSFPGGNETKAADTESV